MKIETIINNIGHADAEKYEIGLFITRNGTGSMNYDEKDKVNSTELTINKSKSEKINLFWNSPRPGIWKVGVKIITTSTKRDLNDENNQREWVRWPSVRNGGLLSNGIQCPQKSRDHCFNVYFPGNDLIGGSAHSRQLFRC